MTSEHRTNDSIAELAFRVFASLHPHEAAEQDWHRFADYVRTQNPTITDEEIRDCLTEATVPTR